MWFCIRFFLNQSLSSLPHLVAVEEVGSQGQGWACAYEAGTLWTQALCPAQWWKEGSLTLTCQKTGCQTHSHRQAESPGVDEHLVAGPRNDKTDAVAFRHHATEVTGDKKHCLYCQECHQENVSPSWWYILLSFSCKAMQTWRRGRGIPRSSSAYFNPWTLWIMNQTRSQKTQVQVLSLAV